MMTELNHMEWSEEKINKLMGHYKEILSYFGGRP